MDATDYPSLEAIARMNGQLAVGAARVDAIVSAQLDSVERLFRAAHSRDWDAVARASEALARQAEAAKNRTVGKSARAVCDALRMDPTGTKTASKLADLLSVCRAARLRS